MSQLKNKVYDFPKLESPFVRVLKSKDEYIVTDKINEGYEWVFEEDDVLATEKLDGTNVSIVIENGIVVAIFNRTNRIPFIGGTMSKIMTEGINNALEKNRFMLVDGQHFGELIGPKVNGNPYNLTEHEWIPFDYVKKHLAYKSWGKYPKDFKTISDWFEKDLFSLFIRAREEGKVQFPEGVVFHRKNGQMAKLRRDMFSWYKGNRHKD
jgi:hypothetical protein